MIYRTIEHDLDDIREALQTIVNLADQFEGTGSNAVYLAERIR